jgi:uncharacterized protein YbjQ (UPF0145 family)
MKQLVIISTTDTLEGMEIEKYYDLISTNVVLGTNILSDLGASFSDLFGGTSDMYQNKLEKIYKLALDKLRLKASNLKANGVVGVKVDFDEISGGGKSMFMISVSGMAVRLKALKKDYKIREESRNTILPEDLDTMVNKLKILAKVKSNNDLTDQDWEFLVENSASEAVWELLQIYLAAFKDYPNPVNENQKMLRKYFPQLLRQLGEDTVSEHLYPKISENPLVISTLLRESESFSPVLSLELFTSGEFHSGIATLKANKRSYTSEDLEPMASILEHVDRIPITGKNETVKVLLGSKEVFVCEQNHQNVPTAVYCYECGRNRKGLVREEVEQLEEFKLRVEGLKILLRPHDLSLTDSSAVVE